MNRQCPQYATDEQVEEYKKQVEEFLKNQNIDRNEMVISLDLFEAWGSKHTNGPWAVNNQMGIRIESENEHGWANHGWIIAELKGPDAEANAHLITAAPELLEALEAVNQHLCYGISDIIDALKDISSAAIAKAKGEV